MSEPTPRTVATEAWLDATSQRGRSGLAIALALVALGALAVVEGLGAGDLVAQEARFVHQGGATVAIASESGPLDAATCAGVADQPWARAVGGYATTDAASIARSPSTRYTRFLTTADALPVIAPGQTPPADILHGVVLGPAAADSLGVDLDDVLHVDGQPRRVAMVLSDGHLRVPLFERAIVVVGRATTVDSCLVDVDRASADVDLLAARAVFGGGPDIRASMYTQRGDFAMTPQQALAARPLRTGWLPVGVLLGALLALDVWTRRSELAVQRATGGSVPTLTAIVVTTRALLLLPAAVAAMSIGVGLVMVGQGRLVPDQVVLMLRQITGSLVVALTVVIATAAATTARSSATTLKDR